MEDESEDEHFAALRETFRARLPGYHESLVAAQRAFLTSGDEGVRDLRKIAHTLAGAAGTFGFPEIGEIALDLEQAADAALAGEGTRADLIGPLRQLIREIDLSL